MSNRHDLRPSIITLTSGEFEYMLINGLKGEHVAIYIDLLISASEQMYNPEASAKKLHYEFDDYLEMLHELAEIHLIKIFDDSFTGFQVIVKGLNPENPKPILRPSKVNANQDRKKGFVYVLQSPTGAYKIGRTKSPEDRLKTFSVKLPFEVEYTCLIKAEDMYSAEKRLHEKFSEKRINGEWFKLNENDIDYIKSLQGASNE